MAYHGEVLNQSGLIKIDCSQFDAVAVSGDGLNICGHLLLHTGPSSEGYYFHVAELNGYPRYMDESGYRRYLSESGKNELRRIYLSLPLPQEASRYLERLMSNKWIWGGIPNNCVAFVEEVINAGGGIWSSYSNCPDLATQATIPQRIEEFLGQLEGEIYNLYGVPNL